VGLRRRGERRPPCRSAWGLIEFGAGGLTREVERPQPTQYDQVMPLQLNTIPCYARQRYIRCYGRCLRRDGGADGSPQVVNAARAHLGVHELETAPTGW
jgi:hypothetical protein